MEIIKIQENELIQARNIQKQCVDLHLPTPPVVSWVATLIDENGNETQQTIAKANSYVRNALNLLAKYVGLVAPVHINGSLFGDSAINLRSTNANITNSLAVGQNYVIGLGDTLNPIAEDINYYQPTPISTSNWTWGTTQHFSDFDTISRKLITQLTTTYMNISPSPLIITESNLYCGQSNPHAISNTMFLLIRDVFSPIVVQPAQTIRFTYQTEVLFPL